MRDSLVGQAASLSLLLSLPIVWLQLKLKQPRALLNLLSAEKDFCLCPSIDVENMFSSIFFLQP